MKASGKVMGNSEGKASGKAKGAASRLAAPVTSRGTGKPTRPTNIAEQLRLAILASGLSQYALAQSSGIAHPLISRFLSGKRDLRLESAAKLCAALGLELREKN